MYKPLAQFKKENGFSLHGDYEYCHGMSKKLTQIVDGARDPKNAKKIVEGIDRHFGGTDGIVAATGIVAAGIPIVKAVAAGEKVITTTKTVKAVGLGAVGAGLQRSFRNICG